MGGALAELFVEVGADTTGLSAGMRTAAGDVDRAAGQMESQVGQRMASTGATLTRSLTLPLIAAAGAAAKMSIDFDTTMSRIQGLAGASASEVDAMRESVLALSRETTVGPDKLAEAMYFIASSGIKGAAAMDALEMSAKASAAGLGEVSVVADAVTSAMNAYGPEVLSAAQATDVLVGIVKEGKGEADEMAGQLGRILPFAAQLGVTFNDLGAGLAYLTRSSGDSRLATTQLGGALQHMLVPSAQGRQALEEVGLSAEGLREMIKERGLLGALVELDNRFGHSEQKWKQLVEEGQAVAGILSLVKNGGEDAAPVFDALGDSAGNLDNAFGAFAESAGFEAKQSFAELQVALVELGDQLIPAISGIARFGATAATAFGSLPGPVQTAILVFAGFAAALGPLMSAGGNLIRLWGMMPSAVTAGVQSLIAATQAAYAANPVLFALSAAVMAAVAAWSVFSGSQDAEPVQELTAAIQEQGAALGELSQAWIANQLAQGGTVDLEIIERMTAAGRSVEDLEAALSSGGDALNAFMDEIGLARATNETDPLGDFSDWVFGEEGPEAARDRLRALSEEFKASAGAADVLNDQGIAAAGGLGAMGDASEQAARAMEDTKAAIEGLFAAALGAEGARVAFQLGIQDLTDSITEGTFSLDQNTRAGLESRQALVGLAGDAMTAAGAYYAQTSSIEGANFVLASHINQLSGVMQQTGMSEEAAAEYIATLLGIPPEEVTDIRSNANLMRILTDELNTALGQLPPSTQANISSNVRSVLTDVDRVRAALAALDGSTANVSVHTRKLGANLPTESAGGRVSAMNAAMAGVSIGTRSADFAADAGVASMSSSTTSTNSENVTVLLVTPGEALRRLPAAARDRARSFLEGRT